MDYVLILSTVGNEEDAKTLADTLVSEKIAACVNIVSGIQSIYEWQGERVHDSEYLLLIKTTKNKEQNIYIKLMEIHPYETPEIISIPIQKGAKNYLTWLSESVL